ncbi:MAG: (2Fe-2S)-binding protein [Acidimicrobiales bacterium]
MEELRRLSENPGSDSQWVQEVLARKQELVERIEASEAVPIVVPIQPPSPDRRFDWGEDGPAATALANAVLTDVQQAMIEAGGVQCGFCTPGFVVAIHDLLDRVPDPGPFEVREALAGNLCRCTGYGRILAAVEQVVTVRGNGR